ncbi:MAG: YraN family protein [Cellulosilyticaceae bacterium]
MNYMPNVNPKSNNRKIGSQYELLAKKYLLQNQYTILEMNYRCKSGEIDIIAKDGEYIIFVEVKYRSNTKFGYPRESVNYYKQKRIIAAAKYYLFTHRWYHKSCRFDVLEILYDQVTYIKNAFIEG